MKSELARSLQSLPKDISGRIMTLALDLELDTNVTLVSCYAPTMSRPDQYKDDVDAFSFKKLAYDRLCYHKEM